MSTSKPFHSANAARSSSALLGEQVRVFLPEAFQQPRRALDVREQERDGAGRDGSRRLPEARVIGDAQIALQLGGANVRTTALSPVQTLERAAADLTSHTDPSVGVSVDTPSEPPLRCPDP